MSGSELHGGLEEHRHVRRQEKAEGKEMLESVTVTDASREERFISLPVVKPLMNREIRVTLISLIDLAKVRILVSAYGFEDVDVYNASLRAHSREVMIPIVVDREQAVGRSFCIHEKETLKNLLEWSTE